MLIINKYFKGSVFMRKGRPKKVRYIQKMPKISQFSPRGRAGRPDEIELTIDQFEALKLAEYQGFSQVDGAKAMGISRPSFGRILREARKVVAIAIVDGKIIRIRMGSAQVGVRSLNMRKIEIKKRRLVKKEVNKFSRINAV